MKDKQLNERVAALEREVAELKRVLANGKDERPWLNPALQSPFDEMAKRVEESIRKAREADRRKAAKPKTRKRKVSL